MKAIIFDFDGVLADTYEFSKNATKKAGHDVSHETFKAHHDGNVFEKPAIPFTEESGKKFHEYYFEGIQNVEPFFSKEVLEKLSNTYSLYIISSNQEPSINKFLDHYNLNMFKEILGENFHRSKIEKFKYLFKKYSLQPNDCIFISDTLGDIKEGRKVDVRTIALDFGFHDRERLKRDHPFKIVSNVDEMIEALKEL